MTPKVTTPPPDPTVVAQAQTSLAQNVAQTQASLGSQQLNLIRMFGQPSLVTGMPAMPAISLAGMGQQRG